VTFAEATHALPQEMHMNADYPFMLPPIVEKFGPSEPHRHGAITVRGKGGLTRTVPIKHGKNGTEYAELEQSSAFEKIYQRKPTRFRLLPFKEETSR
jgi:hypothetical protein